MRVVDVGRRTLILLVVWTCGKIGGNSSSVSVTTPPAFLPSFPSPCEGGRRRGRPKDSVPGPGGHLAEGGTMDRPVVQVGPDVPLVERIRGGRGLKRERPVDKHVLERCASRSVPHLDRLNAHDRDRSRVGRPPGRPLLYPEAQVSCHFSRSFSLPSTRHCAVYVCACCVGLCVYVHVCGVFVR